MADHSRLDVGFLNGKRRLIDLFYVVEQSYQWSLLHRSMSHVERHPLCATGNL